MKSAVVDIDFDTFLTDTRDAWLVAVEQGKSRPPKELWIPKSIGEIDQKARVVSVPVWWAEQKDLL